MAKLQTLSVPSLEGYTGKKQKNTSSIKTNTPNSYAYITSTYGDNYNVEYTSQPIDTTPKARTTGGGGDNSQGGKYTTNKKGQIVEAKTQQKRVAELNTVNRNTDDTTRYQAPQKKSLSEFNMNLSKSERYRQMSSNLSSLSGKNLEAYGEKTAGWSTYNSIMPSVTATVSAINPWVGLAVGVIWGVSNLFNQSGDYKEKAQLYSNMEQSITGYLTNLTNRDTTILNTMDEIYSSLDSMRGAYGSEFVNTMYNFYLAQSGMTSDAYSLLTGNFETFEDIGYGNVSAENGVFDTLTDGNQALFNNIYAQITLEDITGNKNLMDSLVQSLYGADTELGLQLREYEYDLRNLLQNATSQTNQLLLQGRTELASLEAEARSEAITAAEQIGTAESESATSGLRGGTTGNNAALARLSRDLGQIQRSANTAAILGTLKYNVMNIQKNASSTAFSYRNAQKKAVYGALNENVGSWNAIGRSGKSSERTGNYYLTEAQSYERQFNEQFEDVAEKDKEKIFSAST